MKKELKNKYFLLRHGKNIHQKEKKDVFYIFPDDTPPCELNEEGVEEIKLAGNILKDKKIDFIICSDILRTRQTASIVSDIIVYDKEKIRYDSRLRDINWGVFGGKTMKEGWDFYNNDMIKRFDITPEDGESWTECQNRMVNVLDDLEKEFNSMTILIISHGDPLWLLKGYVDGKTREGLINNDGSRDTMKTGEVREI